MQSLFTYGTLMQASLVATLIGRIPSNEPATLEGYQRYRIKDAPYPAIIPGTGEVVGCVYHGLTEDELSRLDSYEGSGYERENVIVGTQQDTAPTPCLTYVLAADCRHLLSDEPWHPEDWAPHSLD